MSANGGSARQRHVPNDASTSTSSSVSRRLVRNQRLATTSPCRKISFTSSKPGMCFTGNGSIMERSAFPVVITRKHYRMAWKNGLLDRRNSPHTFLRTLV